MERDVGLSSYEFDVLRAAASQFSEISPKYLGSIAVSDDDCTVIWRLISDADALAHETVSFRLVSVAESGSCSAAGDVVYLRLTERQWLVLCRLARRVLSAFGERELFLRTGFQSAEVTQVVEKLCGFAGLPCREGGVAGERENHRNPKGSGGFS
ncbi:hypothetical protein [Kribbella sp. CA-293567]|uniref:hypothetical protein n=1 Tax=Kribbella sp. CA-293567 TaxID=3002436 RepID=UPI0022DE86B4|nr:hypothetical protein [Kribbella sp. CA-293567]WBQ04092.1 hypothetical protein OX958_29510 [Kribbella sp. CA-293567]